MARKMGRIQAYEYWSEQYHSARVLVKTLSNMRSSADVKPADRQRASRVMVKAIRRQARMLVLCEQFEKPVKRGA